MSTNLLAPGQSTIGRTVATALLLLLAMGIVFWLRVQPLMLGGLEPLVDDTLHKWVTMQVMSQPNQRRPRSVAERDAMVERWKADNSKKLATYKADLLDKSREALTIRMDDGTRYPYMGDADSYHWLRAARNFGRTGSACDEIIDGLCRDTRALAPVGSKMVDGDSLHIRAIALVANLVRQFEPGAPLMYAAMMVPVIIGVLGVIPAFAIGWRLAGPAGGFAASLAISANAHFLQRSAGADTDAWNVVVPLFVVWLVIEALIAPTRARRAALAAGAAAMAGFHAAIWSGWTLGVAVVVCGVIASMALVAIRSFVTHGAGSIWSSGTVRGPGLVIGVFLVVTTLLVALLGKADALLSLPVEILRTAGLSLFSGSDAVSATLPWPDMFQSVSELAPQTRLAISEKLGWEIIVGGFIGLFLIVLPRNGLNFWHAANIGWISLFVGFLIFSSETSRLWFILAIAIPPLTTLVMELRDPEKPPAGHAAELVIIFWVLATLYLAHQGGRFVMLLVAPFGIVFGIAAGRLFDFLQRLTAARPKLRLAGTAGAALLIALSVAPTTYAGWNTAYRFVPGMADGWWESFSRIRNSSPKDAIVTTWWDQGHWAKYVTDRRVTADGATLRTHVHHWLGRALATPNPRESLGILRMLHCGSDATPHPEAARGAFGRLVAGGMSELLAYKILRDLVVRSRPAAAAILRKAGLDETRTQAVLAATHCKPPQSFLVLSSKIFLDGQAGWLRVGAWDYQNPRRKAPARLSHHTSSDWHRCQPAGSGLVCPLNLIRPESSIALERFDFPVAAPEKGRVILRDRATGKRTSRPAQIIIATGQGLRELPVQPGTPKDLAILLDPRNRTAFVGSKPFLLSTFARLVLLKGRHAPGFRRLYERQSIFGAAITTWRVRFPDDG